MSLENLDLYYNQTKQETGNNNDKIADVQDVPTSKAEGEFKGLEKYWKYCDEVAKDNN